MKRGRRVHRYSNSGTDIREDKSKKTTVTIMKNDNTIALLREAREDKCCKSPIINLMSEASIAVIYEPTISDNAESNQKIITQAVSSSPEVVPSGITHPNSASQLARGSPKTIKNCSFRPEISRGTSTTTLTNVEQPLGVMKAAVRLLSDTMDFTDVVADYLSTTNTNFTVIGIIGPQGSGKSTLLSMIAGNDHLDMYRHYAFRPASREAVECCRYQTQKISVYVTKSRMILLDCQAISSASILNHLLATSSLDGSRPGGSKSVDLCRGFAALSGEVESLHLTAFLLQVCHTIILSVDWFIDIDVIRHVRTAEMLRVTPTHYSPETMKYKPNRKINFECLFNGSQLNIKGGLSLGGLGCKPYGEIASNVNYVLLSEMKPRPKTDASAVVLPYLTADHTPFRTVIDYEEILHPLRIRLLSLPKEPFILGNQPFTEIQWYEFATRTWRATHGSAEIAKYASSIMKIADE
ncbi:hypothetical protein X798_05299 [Onchocerca flexuosa]|uniref:Protein SMG9 n=1 Tax=Onchocerca flexuosa TaxID=387005 RepID=A0A238BQU1_9BILA|nr:hypothetical protein X798_05299 [Onchocerca flexuosa]